MESINIKELNDRIQMESSFVDILTMEMNKVIVGQKHLVENLLIGLLANGHILLEGVPGLAKTLAINTLSQAVDSKFSRIQFTPDLLPADVLGTLIYSQKTEQKGHTRVGFQPGQSDYDLKPHSQRGAEILRMAAEGVGLFWAASQVSAGAKPFPRKSVLHLYGQLRHPSHFPPFIRFWQSARFWCLWL